MDFKPSEHFPLHTHTHTHQSDFLQQITQVAQLERALQQRHESHCPLLLSQSQSEVTVNIRQCQRVASNHVSMVSSLPLQPLSTQVL